MAGLTASLDTLPAMLILPDGSAAPAASAFRIFNAGCSDIGADWTSTGSTPYRTSHHSIQQVLAGGGALWSAGSWLEFRPGMLLVVPGHCWVRRRGVPGMHLRWLGFGVEPLALDLRLGGLGRILQLDASEHPAVTAGIAAAAAATDPLSATRTLLALHHVVALMLHAVGEAPLAEPDPAVLRARSFIEQRYLDMPSLAAIARAAGRSPHHLHERFSAAVGCTPSAYAQRLRLRDAQALLLGGDLQVHEIARRCGYADPFHFARVLRRSCGVSPSELRRRR